MKSRLVFGLLLLLAGNALAQSVTLSLAGGSGAPGATLALPLSIHTAAGGQAAAVEWVLGYSPADVASLRVDAGAAASAAGKTVLCTPGAGTYTCLVSGMNSLPVADGVLAVVTLQVSPSAAGASTAVAVSGAVAASPAGDNVTAAASGAVVTIVQPPPVAVSLTSLVCAPSSIAVPGAASCTASLSAVAPAGGLTVAVASNNAALTVPAAVSVAAGASGASFTVNAADVAADTSVVVSASLNGASKAVSLLLVARPALAALTCTPLSLVTGGTANCTVSLTKPAASGGMTIGLSSSGAALAVPASVLVPAGAANAGFAATAGSVPATTNVTVTATDGVVSRAAQLTIGVAAFTGLRVNAGGPRYTDPQGNLWSADTGFTGGIAVWNPVPISNTTTPELYQTQRFGTMSYQFAVPAATYAVVLKFAETDLKAPGQRLFNVAINGQTVLSNFDIYAQAGGAAIALDKQFSVNASGGLVSIVFQNVVGFATINAIEIRSAPVAVSVTPTTAALTVSQARQFSAVVTGTANQAVSWSLTPAVGSISPQGLYVAPAAIAAAQTVTVRATSQADPSQSAVATVSLTPPASFRPVRVNAGGAAYTDPAGNLWSADNGYSGGSVRSIKMPIAGTSTQALYQTARSGNFSYRIAVPNGTYTVNLKFAELANFTAGRRIFNVILNGQTVLANFDIVSQTGLPLTALDKQFKTQVAGGAIQIQLVPVTGDALLNAFEILAQ